MTRQQYDDLWHDAERVRAFLAEWAQSAPELFPADFDQGYCLHGFGRESRKLPGLKLRKIFLADGTPYWLRPSFITSYMTGTVDELAYPLLLAAHGVPPWLLTIGFGHSDMYWYRVIERLGRNSLVGTTVRDAAQLPAHLAADEHHADWAGQKGYVATTVGGGCVLGVALTASADDLHLQEAYGVFAAEPRDVAPEYAPERSRRRLGGDVECVPGVVYSSGDTILNCSNSVTTDYRPLSFSGCRNNACPFFVKSSCPDY